MTRKNNRKLVKLSSRPGKARACVRSWIMSSNACDYGAAGAALFDIVKAHF
jgi:hypothetical protein